MSVMTEVKEKIDQFPKCKLFTVRDFYPLNVESAQALTKSLSRLVKTGEIKRFSKGRYYIPKITRFGERGPSEEEILESFTRSNGNIVAYKSGITAYYEMGLTTQIPNVIILASTQSKRKSLPTQYLRCKTVRAYANPEEAGNITLLQILDAVRDFKKIPDTSPNDVIKRLRTIIKKNVKEKDFDKLMTLVVNYPPYTRAVLGAILDSLEINTNNLKSTINVQTKFKLKISNTTLPNKKDWNII